IEHVGHRESVVSRVPHGLGLARRRPIRLAVATNHATVPGVEHVRVTTSREQLHAISVARSSRANAGTLPAFALPKACCAESMWPRERAADENDPAQLGGAS